MTIFKSMTQLKVLMLCYHFPPNQAVAAKRSFRFFEGLKRNGWLPLVITRSALGSIGNHEIFQAKGWDMLIPVNFLNGLISKVFGLFKIKYEKNWVKELFLIPDEYIGWIFPAFLRGWQILKREKANLIYVSCSPFSTLVPAVFLKKLFKLPLVIDYRDPWTLNPYHDHLPYHQFLIEKIEGWVMRHVDHLILNSEGSMKIHQRKYPQIAMSVITNGLDFGKEYWSNLLSSVPPEKDKFIIYYSGILNSQRKPDLLFDALSKFPYRRRCNFICPVMGYDYLKILKDKAFSYGISKICYFPNWQSADETNKNLVNADLLYLKQGFEKKNGAYVAIGAKTYEYLASGTPILIECPPGDNVDIVKQNAGKVYCVTEDDLSLMVGKLSEAYDDWRQDKIKKNQPSDDFFEKYSAGALTAQLIRVFESLLLCV